MKQWVCLRCKAVCDDTADVKIDGECRHDWAHTNSVAAYQAGLSVSVTGIRPVPNPELVHMWMRFGEYVACTCGHKMYGQELAALSDNHPHAYDAKRNALADTCQRLQDENTKLLAENAMLRREVERMRAKR